jgi:hypothetical protein
MATGCGHWMTAECRICRRHSVDVDPSVQSPHTYESVTQNGSYESYTIWSLNKSLL